MLRLFKALLHPVALITLAGAALAGADQAAPPDPEPATPSSAVPQVTHFRLAVLDFGDNTGGTVKASEILYLSERVRGAARLSLPSRNFLIMTRENIQELLPAGRSLADCVGDCAVETGRKIGADYVVTGEVSSFAGEIRMTVNLHEVAKGNLLKQVNVKGAQLLEVETELDNKVQELLGALRNKFAVEDDLEQEERAMSGAVDAWKAGGQAKVIVTFASNPTDAVVQIDGELIGRTPCRRPLLPGSYQVSIQQVRYVAHEQILEVKAGTAPAVSVALTPNFGWLTVESDPAGLTVTIDKVNAGRTPMAAREMATGRHEVVVEGDSYHAEKREVVLDRNERENIRVAPVPRNGGLTIEATDADGNATQGRVLIDDVDAGSTYEPITVLKGRHRVVILGEAGSWTEDVTIAEEKNLTLEVRMPGTAKMPKVFRKVGRTAGFSVLTTYARLVEKDLNNRYPTTEEAWGVRVEKTLIGRTGLGAQIGYNGAYVFTVIHSWNRFEIGPLGGVMFQNDGDNCLYPFGELRLRALLGAVVNLDISGGYVRWHNQQGVPLVTVGVGAGF
jgi:hypothetical protein